MTTIHKFALTLIGIALLAMGSARAQETGSDQADVWAAVEAQWAAEEKGDNKWIDSRLTDDFQGWERQYPAPRSKTSIKLWDRLGDDLGKTVAHELFPLAIVVHDDVAVAHYLYRNAFEDKDGEIELTNGRYTDVLVRTDDGWKFIAWHGGDDD
jgi:ketosteroid isomerase-like protein